MLLSHLEPVSFFFPQCSPQGVAAARRYCLQYQIAGIVLLPICPGRLESLMTVTSLFIDMVGNTPFLKCFGILSYTSGLLSSSISELVVFVKIIIFQPLFLQKICCFSPLIFQGLQLLIDIYHAGLIVSII